MRGTPPTAVPAGRMTSGVKAVLVGTGQTTIMQGGKYGVALDALVPQFCSGEVEHQPGKGKLLDALGAGGEVGVPAG